MMRALTLAAALVLTALPALAETRANALFGAFDVASQQAPMPIGSYAKGCAAGLVQLPETGPTWQAMRLSRNRNWGQPEMVQFLAELSVAATKWAGPGCISGISASRAAGR